MKPTPRARAETYQSFARLFLVEPDVYTLDARFARALPNDQRDLRVEFTRLFSMNVFPYASVFLDPEGWLDTETTARVAARYNAGGFEPAHDLPIAAPDHFGAELSFVAYLLSSDREDAAIQFLRAEVFTWSEIFLHAVEKNACQDFYRSLARETRQWLCGDFDSIQPSAALPLGNARSDPAPAEIEEDDLDSIVGFLISPARSGIFLSKEDLSAIGRELELPMSFGDRGSMLTDLFRAAGEFEKIQRLVGALNAEVEDWIGCYSSDSGNYSAAAFTRQIWIPRAEATLAKLCGMRRASEALQA